jgi:hypothetical protein
MPTAKYNNKGFPRLVIQQEYDQHIDSRQFVFAKCYEKMGKRKKE